MDFFDFGMIGLYAVGLLAIAIRSSRGVILERVFALGGRNLPGGAVLVSLTATELSAATFIGVPHAAYTGDWSYLQLAVGALVAKLCLARFVIPLYHQLGIVTVYGFLSERFGTTPQRAAALAFAVGRVLASGARLFIAGLALAAMGELPLSWAIVFCGLAAGSYTLIGGIRAVIWTDTLQACVLVVAALGTLLALSEFTDGGLFASLAWARELGRSQIVHLDPFLSLVDGRAFGSAVFGAFFLTLATHATDHDMVQRLLTTRNARSGARALVGSALLNFPITLLFLVIGTGLAHFYSSPPDYPIANTERILPLFALHELPAGLLGLLFAGLFAAAMSSLDSAICALATSWTHDILPPKNGAAFSLGRIRRVSAVFALAITVAALAMGHYHELLDNAPGASPLNLVEFALSAMTIVYGGLLGLFALGIMTRMRGDSASTVSGLVVGAGTGLALFLHPLLMGQTLIAWTWWIPISAAISFTVAASRPTGAISD